MIPIIGSVAIGLLLLLPTAHAQQKPSSSPLSQPIGLVTTVTGEWSMGTPAGMVRLTAGQDVPEGATLTIPPAAAGQIDTREIVLKMYDGTVRHYRCAVPSTCDGPIPLAIAKVEPYIRRLFESLLRKLQSPEERRKPLLVGSVEPLGVVERRNGVVQLAGFVGAARTAAIESAASKAKAADSAKTASGTSGTATSSSGSAAAAARPSGSTTGSTTSSKAETTSGSAHDVGSKLLLCDLPEQRCERVEGKNAAFKIDEDGLYSVELAGAPHGFRKVVVAIDSQRFAPFSAAYETVMTSPVMKSLSLQERQTAEIWLLESISQTVQTRQRGPVPAAVPTRRK